MERNCMNCANSETAVNCQSVEQHYRCSLDRSMRVNRRMCCEEWTGRATIVGAVSVAAVKTEKVSFNGKRR